MNFKSPLFCACLLLSACAFDMNDPTTGEQEPLDGSAERVCKNALTQSEEQITLKLIDDICGDTWCEGDNDFAFRHLSCTAPRGTHPGVCQLRLQIIPREGVLSPRASYNRTCTTPHFTGFDSLVATAPNGYQSLQPAYYDELTSCISNLEATLPR
jgi:hypothetical protein